MLFNNVEEMKTDGFYGFETVGKLMESNCISVPEEAGVYFVLHLSDEQPQFLERSVGGFFKRKNPSVPIETLGNSWVPGSKVIYIGKAGGEESSEATLRSRLRQYMRFGQGAPVGHWGGRYIWQIEGNRDLIVCWKVASEAVSAERQLLDQFQGIFGVLPFANLRR